MNAKSWMGRRFFTGGTIPSMTFFHHFTDDLVVERTEVEPLMVFERSPFLVFEKSRTRWSLCVQLCP